MERQRQKPGTKRRPQGKLIRFWLRDVEEAEARKLADEDGVPVSVWARAAIVRAMKQRERVA
jgi:hypothetical protein